MNKILIILALLLSTTFTLSAQKQSEKRRQWTEEMRQLRVKYITTELKLTAEQREKFVPAYEAMSRETDKVVHDTRNLYQSVKKKGDSATDLEKEKAAEAAFEAKGKVNAIEMRYYNKFKTILTPDQLFQLREAEHKFARQLVKHRRDKAK